MNVQTLITVAPYLCSDTDRLHILQTCREFWALAPYIEFTDTYEYGHVKDVVDKFNLRNVWYTFSINQNDINTFKNLDGFKLGAIPYGVTIVNYYSDIHVSEIQETLETRTIRRIHFGNRIEIVSLPKNVKSISVPNEMYVPYLPGVQVEHRPMYAMSFNLDAFNYTPSGSVNWGRLVHIHLPDVFDGCVVAHKN